MSKNDYSKNPENCGCGVSRDDNCGCDAGCACEDYSEYFIVGGNGLIEGIRDDAPPSARRECEKLLRKQSHI